jgi:hypothetical protein
MMTSHQVSETPGGGTEREIVRVWIREVVSERHSLCMYITWKPKTS